MDKRIVLSILGALVLAVFLWFIARLTLPLAESLVWALIIGISTHPHYERIANRYPGRPNRSAALMVGIITLCLILPITALVFAVAQNATELYHQSENLFHSMGKSGIGALSRIPYADRVIGLADRFGLDITGHASEFASTASKLLLAATSGAVKNVAHFVLTLAMAVFILYFVYRDGERIVNACVKRFASNRALAQHYLSEIRGTTTAVVVGTVFTCIIQGAFAGVGYYFAGLPAPILCGSLTAIAALVPVVGTAVVWVPLAAYLALTGAFLKAGLLAGWCIVFVGIADNMVRPLMVGASRDIPVLAVLFGAVGGAEVLGLVGLIVGPIIFAVLVTIFRDAVGVEEEGDPDTQTPAQQMDAKPPPAIPPSDRAG